jgi:hypothetical protein
MVKRSVQRVRGDCGVPDAGRPRLSRASDLPTTIDRMHRRRYFKGEISAKTFEEWNRETGGKKLPERVKKKKRATRKRKA